MRTLVVAMAVTAGVWSVRLNTADAPDVLQVSFENRGEAAIRGTDARFGIYRGKDLFAWAAAPSLQYEAIELDPGGHATRTVPWSQLDFSTPRGEPIAPAEIERAMSEGGWSIGLTLVGDGLTVWSNRHKLGPPGDRAELQGTWTTRGSRLDFEGDRFRIDGREETFTLDESADPKQIDFGDGASAIRGIYEIDGEILRISTAPPGADRPTRFEAGHTVVRHRS